MSAALAKIHIAKKELGLHDDDYRATLLRLVGQESSKGLSDAQAGIVLDEFKRRGWTPRVTTGGKTAPSTRSKAADAETAKKARALWISLWQLGVVRDRSESALESFAARQLKVDRLAWADGQQMYRLIEALKNMAIRNGWSQDVSGIHPKLQVIHLKKGLVRAQSVKLGLTKPGYDTLTDDSETLSLLIERYADLIHRQMAG